MNTQNPADKTHANTISQLLASAAEITKPLHNQICEAHGYATGNNSKTRAEGLDMAVGAILGFEADLARLVRLLDTVKDLHKAVRS
jgi:hypothetical protein